MVVFHGNEPARILKRQEHAFLVNQRIFYRDANYSRGADCGRRMPKVSHRLPQPPKLPQADPNLRLRPSTPRSQAAASSPNIAAPSKGLREFTTRAPLRMKLLLFPAIR